MSECQNGTNAIKTKRTLSKKNSSQDGLSPKENLD
jgi:hypothetical protein